MGVTYEMAGDILEKDVYRVMRKYHGGLYDAGLKVDVLLAYGPKDENGDLLRRGIMIRRMPCKACVRIIGLKDRAAGRGDAEILIDGDKISEWSDKELAAVIDHELTHLELQTNSEGGVIRDDLDRPKLKMRLHDREFGWFDVVAKRHGQHATEVQQARQMLEDVQFRQLYLPGMEEAA